MKHRPAGTTSGAEQDFRIFVQGIAASLHRTAYLLCGDWYMADDLVQETLAKAYTNGTYKGQPVINLAAGDLITGGGTDTLTINADTGLPIKDAFNGATVVTYTVSRVTLADVANGKF